MSEKATVPNGSSKDSKEVQVEYVDKMDNFDISLNAAYMEVKEERNREELKTDEKNARIKFAGLIDYIKNGMTVRIKDAKGLNKTVEPKKKTKKVKKADTEQTTEK